MEIHKPFNNKMRKFRPLLIHPDVMVHVPDTEWYSEDAVVKMLERYPTLFIKPNKGRIGIGVMRLKKLEKGKFEVHYQDQAVVTHSIDEALKAIVERMNPHKRYLVQQGIDLATVLDRPFDLRVVMHKIDGEWQRSAWCVKISPPQLIVTNHARGGVILTVDQAMKQNKQLFNSKEIMDQINELCFKICKVYDLYFSFCIVGLDMAVDKNGHIWFIEANTTPDHKMFTKLGDPRIFKRLQKMDRQIRRKSKRLREELKQATNVAPEISHEADATQADYDNEHIEKENH